MDTTSLHDYLKIDTIKKIPVYQRNYSWGEEQCKRLLDDLIAIGKKEAEIHFTGIIMVIPLDLENTHVIVDGQQRITTTLLLLKAFSDVVDSKEAKDLIKFHYLYYGKKKKLFLNKKDDEVFSKILKNQEIVFENEKSLRVYKNYQYFKELIQSYQITDFSILQNGLQRLRFTVLRLDRDKEPQKIFETLNSTGLRLQQSDLVKNYIFMRDIERQEELYRNYWLDIEANITADHLDSFVKNYLIIKNGDEIKIEEVYSQFKLFHEQNKSMTNDELLNDLNHYSKYYKKIVFPKTNSDSKIREALESIENTEKRVFYPFLLQALYKFGCGDLKRDEFFKIISLLENYLIRHAVCGVQSSGYNKYVPKFIKSLSSFESFEKQLLSIKGKHSFIGNREFVENLKTAKIYEIDAIKKGKSLLYRIEQRLSKESVKKDDLTIEHVLPQRLNDNWRKYLGRDWELIHSSFVHNLGNLTLTAYNRELSNKLFPVKKEFFRESNLSLNSYFQGIEVWNKKEIIERRDHLIQLVLQIFKEPEMFGRVEEDRNFFLSDIPENLTGKKPDGFKMLGELTLSPHWRGLYIDFLVSVYVNFESAFEKHIEYGSFVKVGRGSDLISRTQQKGYFKVFENVFAHIPSNSKQILNYMVRIIRILKLEHLSEEKIQIFLK
jgi:uncharacterized protein with ParB-like and HNH nuclease domain